MLWNELYSAQLAGYAFTSSAGTEYVRSTVPSSNRRSPRSAMSGARRLPQVPGSQSSYDQGGQDDGDGDTQGGRGQDYAEANDASADDFDSRRPMTINSNSNDAGRKGTGKSRTRTPSVLASFEEFGPLIARLVMRETGTGPCRLSMMASPMISIALQRTVFGDDGAEEARGTLTIGGLPPSPPGSDRAKGYRGQETAKEAGSGSGLTWAPVRLYTPAQGGAMLPEAPREVYPYAWEAMMGDDVWFNGVKLERSRLGVQDASVGVSALIDTVSLFFFGEFSRWLRLMGVPLIGKLADPGPGRCCEEDLGVYCELELDCC